MSCYFMVNIYLNHPDQRAAYDQNIKEVKPIVESYGGEYLVRTEALTALSEAWRPDRFIIIRFPDRTRMDACFASEQYGRIKALRTETVESRVIIADGI